jgi:hypothetical protein
MKIDTNKLDWIDKSGDVGGIALLTTRIQKFYGVSFGNRIGY